MGQPTPRKVKEAPASRRDSDTSFENGRLDSKGEDRMSQLERLSYYGTVQYASGGTARSQLHRPSIPPGVSFSQCTDSFVQASHHEGECGRPEEGRVVAVSDVKDPKPPDIINFLADRLLGGRQQSDEGSESRLGLHTLQVPSLSSLQISVMDGRPAANGEHMPAKRNRETSYVSAQSGFLQEFLRLNGAVDWTARRQGATEEAAKLAAANDSKTSGSNLMSVEAAFPAEQSMGVPESCSRWRTVFCGCGECQQESELEYEQEKMAAEAHFEETRESRRRLMLDEDTLEDIAKRRKVTGKVGTGLSKCTRCFSYKKSDRFSGSVCTGCKRRSKREVEDEQEETDAIIRRVCKSSDDLRKEETCAACFLVDCDDSDEMVQCDGCNVWVHASCYGGELLVLKSKQGPKEEWVPSIPEGDWFCQACQLKTQPGMTEHKMRCVLCPVRIGSFKRTVDGRWMHLSCMRVMNETEAGLPWQQENLSGICDINWKKWGYKCMVCGTSNGACVMCHEKDCGNTFHVGCAQYAKEGRFVMSFTEEAEWNRRCRDHVPDAGANPIDACSVRDGLIRSTDK